MSVMTAAPTSSARHDFANTCFSDKVRRGIFAPVARTITGYHDAEDRLQDAIASTWWLYCRAYVERGKLLDDALLVYHCRLRAIDTHHRFVPGHRARRADDVYDPRARKRGVELTSPTEEGGEDPWPRLDSAIDFARFAAGLDAIDQVVVAGNLAGVTTTEIAKTLKMSISGAHRRERLLGRRLQRAHARG